MAFRKVFQIRVPAEIDGLPAYAGDVVMTPLLLVQHSSVVLAEGGVSVDATFDCINEETQEVAFQRRFAFPATDPNGDLVAQAYAFVKALPEYADAEEV